MVKFLRRTGDRYSKLGKGRKKKQKWRKPTGRDNKMREKRRGYPLVVSVGYKKDKKLRGNIENKKPVIINNLKELGEIKENGLVILGKIGKKKKIEIVKRAKKLKIIIHKLNLDKFLEKMKKKEKKVKKPEKKIKETKVKKKEIKPTSKGEKK